MNFEYITVRSDRHTLSVKIAPDRTVTVRAPRYATDAEIEGFLLRYAARIEKQLAVLEERAKKIAALPPLTDDEYEALSEKAHAVFREKIGYYSGLMGVRVHGISVRCQRSRWGSCNSKGDISLNCLLLLAPDDVIDSVVVHELCHLKEMNHSKRFYALVYRYCPGYDKSRKWLSENGYLLMARRFGP